MAENGSWSVVFVSVTATLACVLSLMPAFVWYFDLSNIPPDYSLPWLATIEENMRLQLQAEMAATNTLTMLWMTPLVQKNIESLGVDLPRFNSRIAAAVLTQYQQLLAANPSKLLKDGSDANDANTQFFYWQKNGGWARLAATPEIAALEKLIQSAVDEYLQAAGLPDTVIQTRSRQLQIWATVHDSCVKHLAHTHPDSVVSGVYYVKMPLGSGNIVFDDPRGPLPPFDNKLTVRPRMGDLVLFPSWLVHQVTPTPGADERISIAFNVPGEWSTTAGISELYPLQSRLDTASDTRSILQKYQ